MTGDVALKACPFCGLRDAAVAPSTDEEDFEGEVFWSVGCSCTAYVGPWSSEAEAVAAWNTRSPVCEDAREELVERLVNARDQLKHLQAFPKNARGQATAELIALIEAALAKVPQ